MLNCVELMTNKVICSVISIYTVICGKNTWYLQIISLNLAWGRGAPREIEWDLARPPKCRPHKWRKKTRRVGVVLCSSGHAGEGICAFHRVLSRLHDLRNRADASGLKTEGQQQTNGLEVPWNIGSFLLTLYREF